MTKDSRSGLSQVIKEFLYDYFKAHGEALPTSGLYERVMREIEKPLLEITLEAVDGNQKKAAEVLGINRNTLRKKMISMGSAQDA